MHRNIRQSLSLCDKHLSSYQLRQKKMNKDPFTSRDPDPEHSRYIQSSDYDFWWKSFNSRPHLPQVRSHYLSEGPTKACQIFNSPSRTNSTTACDRPFTFNFCITLEMWFRTVFSLINSCWAISFVVLSCTSSSNTSRSLFVSKGFPLRFCVKYATLLARALWTRGSGTQSGYFMNGLIRWWTEKGKLGLIKKSQIPRCHPMLFLFWRWRSGNGLGCGSL